MGQVKNTYRVRVSPKESRGVMTIIRYADTPAEARELAEAEGYEVHGVRKQAVLSNREAFGNC